MDTFLNDAQNRPPVLYEKGSGFRKWIDKNNITVQKGDLFRYLRVYLAVCYDTPSDNCFN